MNVNNASHSRGCWSGNGIQACRVISRHNGCRGAVKRAVADHHMAGHNTFIGIMGWSVSQSRRCWRMVIRQCHHATGWAPGSEYASIRQAPAVIAGCSPLLPRHRVVENRNRRPLAVGWHRYAPVQAARQRQVVVTTRVNGGGRALSGNNIRRRMSIPMIRGHNVANRPELVNVRMSNRRSTIIEFNTPYRVCQHNGHGRQAGIAVVISLVAVTRQHVGCRTRHNAADWPRRHVYRHGSDEWQWKAMSYWLTWLQLLLLLRRR